MPEIKTVTVIGAGTMGRSIACLILKKSLSVRLVDVDPSALVNAGVFIRGDLAREFGDPVGTKNALSRLRTFSGLEEGVSAADLVLEAVPENLTLKREIFQTIDRLCPPPVILATNTSGLRITDIARAATSHPRRIVGTHFYTPADLIPLVEVIKSDYTDPETTLTVMSFLRTLGKDPVLVNQDIPGFIGNRLQHALAREALSLLEKGVAGAGDIDKVARYALGVRLVHTGPLEQRDLNGLDVHLAIAGYLYPELENRTEPSRILMGAVSAGHLGLKTGRGIYDWTGSTPEEVMARKNRQIMAVIGLLAEGGDGVGVPKP